MSNLLPLSSNALNIEIYSQAESLSYSEVAPIKQFADSLAGPMIDEGNRAFSSSRAYVGQRIFNKNSKNTWLFGAVTRMDYALRFSHDTALLFYAKENNLVQESRSHRVFLEANNFRGKGVFIGRQVALSQSLSMQVKLAYLSANEMTYGVIQGEVTSLESDAQGELDLDYFYTEDVVFDRPSQESVGRGYAVDLGLYWQPSTSLYFSAQIQDVLSEIQWDDQQQTLANATTNRVRTNENGEVYVRAALIRKETHGTVKQKLPVQIELNQTFNFGDRHSVYSQQYAYDDGWFQRLGYRWGFSDAASVSSYLDISSGALGLDFSSRYFRIGIITDDFDFEQAKVFGITLGVSAPLAF